MGTRVCLAGIVALLSLPAGAGSDDSPPWKDGRAILEGATEWELFALDPSTDEKKEKLDPKDAFRKWKVLGKTTVKGDARKTLLAALDKGIDDEEERLRKEREKGLLTETGCFQPRHGIRAKLGEQTVEVLICFECRPVYFYLGGRRGHSITNDSPQKAFDKVLKDAGVSVAPRLLEPEKK